MPRGFFTQSCCVLLQRAPSLDELEAVIGDAHAITNRFDEVQQNVWMCGPALVVGWRPEVNGAVTVDILDQPWPDSMGDPETDADLFGAWSTGFFGPGAYPGNLARAADQAWHWPDAADAIDKHAAVVRLRSSYVLGDAADDTPLMPEEYDPIAELDFLTDLATRLLQRLDGAICYFNPNGETLFPEPVLAETLAHNREHDLPSLDIWTNVRVIGTDEGWMAMDTVGNDQLFDVPDLEAAWPEESIEPEDVEMQLRNISLYLLQNGPVIEPGEPVTDAHGRQWLADAPDESLAVPPRDVLRFIPADASDLPAFLTTTPDDGGSGNGDDDADDGDEPQGD